MQEIIKYLVIYEALKAISWSIHVLEKFSDLVILRVSTFCYSSTSSYWHFNEGNDYHAAFRTRLFAAVKILFCKDSESFALGINYCLWLILYCKSSLHSYKLYNYNNVHITLNTDIQETTIQIFIEISFFLNFSLDSFVWNFDN